VIWIERPRNKGRERSYLLGFWRAIAGEGVQVVCFSDVSGVPKAGRWLDGMQNIEKNSTA
jgi:hypothetical protein